jgi:1,2-diacylglycerol 3-alpha-glucosyltransferase
VENGIDLKRFNRKVDGKQLRNRILTDGYEHIVLYLGRVSREKRIDTMIRAARGLGRKDVRFVIAGTGPALDHYRKLAARYKLDGKVLFTGFVDDKDLPKYYAASDMLCMPSTFETQGIVTLEAMACGKPVVGADYMALKNLIVNNYNGEKFAPGSSMECARKIKKVLSNYGEYAGMAGTAEKYSIEKTTDKLLNVYKEVIH